MIESIRRRQIGRDEAFQSTHAETSVMNRDSGMTVANANTGAGYLQTRSWKGLEQNLGQTQVKQAGQGAKGIAMGYENETERS